MSLLDLQGLERSSQLNGGYDDCHDDYCCDDECGSDISLLLCG